VDRKPRVLFLCTPNAARSQMAEGILRDFSKGTVEVYSAGTEPTGVHPLAVVALQEMRIDISGQRSKHVDEFAGQMFDFVATLCDRADPLEFSRSRCCTGYGRGASASLQAGRTRISLAPSPVPGNRGARSEAFTSISGFRPRGASRASYFVRRSPGSDSARAARCLAGGFGIVRHGLGPDPNGR